MSGTKLSSIIFYVAPQEQYYGHHLIDVGIKV